MYIHYFGNACFRLQNQAKDASILVDPYDTKIGNKAPKLTDELIACSKENDLHGSIKGLKQRESKDPLVITRPGEYEKKDIFVHAVAINEGKEAATAFAVNIEGVTFGHLGALNRPLKAGELDGLGRIDVLLLPVGGDTVLTPKVAMDVIGQVEPRMVIPCMFEIKGFKTNLGPLDVFIKEAGITDVESVDKLKLLKRDLPGDDTQFVLMNA